MTYFCPGIVVVELPSSGVFNFLVLLEPSGAEVFSLACYGSNLEAPVRPRPLLVPRGESWLTFRFVRPFSFSVGNFFDIFVPQDFWFCPSDATSSNVHIIELA